MTTKTVVWISGNNKERQEVTMVRTSTSFFALPALTTPVSASRRSENPGYAYALISRTQFHHVTDDTLQMFNVKGQR